MKDSKTLKKKCFKGFLGYLKNRKKRPHGALLKGPYGALLKGPYGDFCS